MAGDTPRDEGGTTAGTIFAELDRLVSGGTPDLPASDALVLGVAVSGGGDSTALLIIAMGWVRERGHVIAAATVDHGLRDESAAEAAGVAGLCARLGIPHRTLRTPNLRDAGGNLSAVAREARFALLGDWARDQGLAAVLLGHTMDDQAETVLMRLARGSGTEGLAAMQPVLRRTGMLWLRPLLGVRREALREVLRKDGIAWIEDPTNEDTDYDRVKARAALDALAPLGIDAEGLARTARHLQRQRRVLERAMDQLARHARLWGAFGEVRLDIAAMAEDEPDTALRLLADCLTRVSGAAYRPRFRALSTVLDRLLAGQGAGVTLSGCLIRCEEGVALICREPNACEPMRSFRAGETVWDRRWRVTATPKLAALEMAARKLATGNLPGPARLGALGEQGLAALRVLADSGDWTPSECWRTAPRAVRQTTPAIWCDVPPDSGQDSPKMLAAPLAGYADRRNFGPDCPVLAENIAIGELPLPAPPTYGCAKPL